ncbi:unnamed protein product [Didymodactylos carnosus]|uniref:Uncharacterized protein n=1 Tax=Didymodactylos carnosus TaxID=1234261 RepID=A0A8S2F9R1_9BILA|nr:unnamed protein product [Didymodactylos carnosus]CAF4202895.1 unnamed protein product [Didymodactylos carnosus]
MKFELKNIGKKDQTNTEKDDEDDDDKQMMGKMDITVKHAILAEQLKTILINDGYNTDVIDEYFKRYRNREDLSILKMDQSKAIKQLQGEFKIFNRQYETLTNDWRKAAIATREVILLNTVEQDQAQTMRTHLDNLDKRFQKLKILVPKALRNAVQLYIDRFAID